MTLPPPAGKDDPDARDLPPDVVLPEPRSYRRGQHWARFMVSFASLALLGVMLALEPNSRLMQVCMLLVALVTMIHFVRWMRSRSVLP